MLLVIIKMGIKDIYEYTSFQSVLIAASIDADTPNIPEGLK